MSLAGQPASLSFSFRASFAIEQGRLAEEAPIASEGVHKVLSRRVLYMALLLHDIAKGRGGDHSELGAKVAEKVCPRLGLDQAETETVSWLVLHHLAMSDTAFKRDIDDQTTINDFAELVQSPERLRLLLVLVMSLAGQPASLSFSFRASFAALTCTSRPLAARPPVSSDSVRQ